MLNYWVREDTETTDTTNKTNKYHKFFPESWKTGALTRPRILRKRVLHKYL